MAECKGCGKCCIVFPINMTKKELHEYINFWKPKKMGDIATAEHLLKNCTRIPTAKAFELAPWMEQIAIDCPNPKRKYYTCKLYDAVNHICTDYENRPAMCSRYPLYGDTDKIRFLLPGCRFHDEARLMAKRALVKALKWVLEARTEVQI